MVTPIKVIIAKPGLDSHYRGAIMVARYLRDRGMEVVYLGNQLPEQIAEAAIQEDANVIGLSCLSGNHTLMVPRLMQSLTGHGLSNVLVVVGGVIPDPDRQGLEALGVAGVFGVGSSLPAIADFIQTHARSRMSESYDSTT